MENAYADVQIADLRALCGVRGAFVVADGANLRDLRASVVILSF